MIGLLSTTKVVAVTLFVTLCVGSWIGSVWYVTSLQTQLAANKQTIMKLETAVELQKTTIDQIRQDQRQIQSIASTLSAENRQREKEVDKLRERFEVSSSGRTRDVGNIAAAKPGLVEKAVNKGTANAIRCMEIASGAPLTKDEKNATRPDQINKECPSIANPNYKPATPN